MRKVKIFQQFLVTLALVLTLLLSFVAVALLLAVHFAA